MSTTTVFGRYVIESKLGQGGMGIVYLASDPSLDRKVALKVITSTDKDAVERFLREAQFIAKLQHPNIVRVYESGTVGNQHYFTMDYIEGTSLLKLIMTRKLTSQSIARVIQQVASALDYAHSQNIIHRDIKPANILVDKDGRAYVTDFGLSKRLSGLDRSLTIEGALVGTPDYMSPEQAKGNKKEIDYRSDIFSLGSTLYQCLTGCLPFPGKELYEVLTKIINKAPSPPHALRPMVPTDLESICLKCLDKDKTKRYQSGAELAIDLNRYLDGAPISARRTSSIIRFWQTAKKNKIASLGVVSIALAGAVLLLTGVISSVKVSRRDEIPKSKPTPVVDISQTVTPPVPAVAEIPRPPTPPAGIIQVHTLSATGKTLAAYDLNSIKLWDYTAYSDISSYLISDVNDDKQKEVLIGTRGEGADKGMLYVLDHKGNVLWNYKTGATGVFWPDDQMVVVAIRVADVDNDGTKEIITVSSHCPWYPHRLCVINAKTGLLKGEYWNPGAVAGDTVTVTDIDNDGICEIIVGCTNNDLGIIGVYLLKGNNVNGQAPPYRGKAPKGTEIWYTNIGPQATYLDTLEVMADLTGDGVKDIRYTGQTETKQPFTRYINGKSG
ncbi:MAG: serine/threonine protein kinase, partial [Planctomycetes bacterium]|nr:serine/threonine protein kinase [Planctomycetota bacterium]